jgi:hypothetical protein
MKFLIDQKFTGISYQFPSAASFIAVSFNTTENRDNAMAKLKKKRFTSAGTDFLLQIRPFGMTLNPGVV